MEYCQIFKKLLDDLVPYIESMPEDMLTDILMNYNEYLSQTNDKHDVFYVLLNKEKKIADSHELMTTRDVALLYHISTSSQREYRQRKNNPLPTFPSREQRKPGTKILYKKDDVLHWLEYGKHL